MTTPDIEPNEHLRALRERIDVLIERLNERRNQAQGAVPPPCANGLALRAEIVRELAKCGFGRADVGPIADAALDGVIAALTDADIPAIRESPEGSAALFRLRAFEVAVVGAAAGAQERESDSLAEAVAASLYPCRVALRGARRMLLPDGAVIVHLRFSALTGTIKS